MADAKVKSQGTNHERNIPQGSMVELVAPGVKPFLWLVGFALVASLIYTNVVYYKKRQPVVGIIKKNGQPILVTSLGDGILDNIKVVNGQIIQKDDLIATVSRSVITPGGQKLSDLQTGNIKNQSQAVRAKFDKIAEKKNFLEERRSQGLKAIEIESRAIKTIIKRLRAQLAKAEKKQNRFIKLFSEKIVSKIDIDIIKPEIRQIKEAIRTQEQALAETDSRRVEQTTEIKIQLDQLGQALGAVGFEESSLQKRQLQVNLQESVEIRASASGEVQYLTMKSGDMVRAGEKILLLKVAEQKLEVELFVPTSALPFVEVEKSIDLMIEAFPVEKYGSFRAVIMKIEPKPMPNEEAKMYALTEIAYRVTAEVQNTGYRSRRESHDFREGMTLAVMLELSNRTIFDWLTEVLQRLWIAAVK